MELYDKFGNEIRELTEDERDKFLPALKKEVTVQALTYLISALILGVLIAYFAIASGTPQYIVAFVILLFGGASVKLFFDAAVMLWHYSSGNVGVLHIHCEGIDFSGSNDKRPSRYIKSRDSKTGKEICYSLNPREFETIRTHYGHLREIDYIILNPENVRYRQRGFYFTLMNSGCVIISSAVFDNVDKAVNQLAEAGGILRAKEKDNN